MSRVAIVAHLYYPDISLEIVDLIEKLTFDFTLFTTGPAELPGAVAARLAALGRPVHSLVTEDRGRDVRPFLEALRHPAMAGHDVVCKVHTKLGKNEIGTFWRQVAFDATIASGKLAKSIIAAFDADPLLALVGQKQLYISGPKFSSKTDALVADIARSVLGSEMPPHWGFVAGTIFWARRSLFDPILDIEEKGFTFAKETGATDGELAHALERVFGLLATVRRLRVGVVAGAYRAAKRPIEIADAPGEPSEKPVSKWLRRTAITVGFMPEPEVPTYEAILADAFPTRAPAVVTIPARLRVTAVLRRTIAGIDSSAYLRVLSPLTFGANADEIALTCTDEAEALTAPIGDICIVQRAVIGQRESAERLVERVRAQGADLIVDHDDALRAMDREHANYEHFSARNATVEFLMGEADQTWLSTDALGLIYAGIARNPVVVPNALDPRIWGRPLEEEPPSPPLAWWRSAPVQVVAPRPLRILYMGTPTHDGDLAMVMAALDALAEDASPGIELTLVGAASEPPIRPWLKHVEVTTANKAYPRFVRWLQERGPFDVGIAPLRSTAFNLAKSDIKVLDYCALGLIPVCSNVLPYRNADRPAGLVHLAADTTAGWLEALRSINPAEKSALRRARLDYVWRLRSIASVALLQRRLIAGLASAGSPVADPEGEGRFTAAAATA